MKIRYGLILVIMCSSLSIVCQASVDSTAHKTASGKVKKAKNCYFPKTKKRAPNWVCTGSDNSVAATAVGSFHKSDAGIAFMEQMAAADARANLAQKLHDEVRKDISGKGGKTVSGGVDREQIKKIADAEMQGAKILKSVYSPKGTLYMLIGLDDVSAQNFRANIRKNIQR